MASDDVISGVIDQAPSEAHLHRALWLIKFLRAMVLHVLLALIAAVLFFGAGIRSVYPIATDLFYAVRAAVIDSEVRGLPLQKSAYFLVLWIVIVAVLALLIWIYRSITNLRRRALRFQALVIIFFGAFNFFVAWSSLQFAIHNLHPGFAALAILAVVLGFVVYPLCYGVTIWRVSFSPERSSLLATLDPRLAPNLWVYFHKLLDLPRTPLRRLSTAAAYVAALAGALLLITSTMHLITVGGTSNKLAALATACRSDTMPLCVSLSERWAVRVPLSLLLAVGGIKLAALLQAISKRLGGLSVSDVLREGDERFILYLRAFETDEFVLPKPRLPLVSRLFSFRPFPARLEEELFDVSDGYRPLIAVGRPGSRAEGGGFAYRTYLEDSEWQGYVAERIRRAERIVMVIRETEGVRWEFERILAEDAAGKTLFLFDPSTRSAEDWKRLEEMVLPQLERAGLPVRRFDPRSIAFFFRAGELVEIANLNRTATSYRTAFSSFLAEAQEKQGAPVLTKRGTSDV
jgi:hypothetical protein